MTGGELRDLRKAHGLTLDALGEALGTSRQAVHNLEQSERLSVATVAAVRLALDRIAGKPEPAVRPVPLACPICTHACDTGPASPAYVLVSHLRSRHFDRAIDVAAPLGGRFVPPPMRAYRVDPEDPGSLSTNPLTCDVVFDAYPHAIMPLPMEGPAAYQWIPASDPGEGAQG
jgi:transcriptional regulator with XRE-family HTH domain